MIYLDFNILKDKKRKEAFLALNISSEIVLLSDDKINAADGYRAGISGLIIDIIPNSAHCIEKHLKQNLCPGYMIFSDCDMPDWMTSHRKNI